MPRRPENEDDATRRIRGTLAGDRGITDRARMIKEDAAPSKALPGPMYAGPPTSVGPSRTQPPRVTQATEFDCWAAALSSWLAAVKSPKAVTQKQLLDKYGAGGIDISLFQTVAGDFGMNTSRLVGSKEFMPERILDLIDKFDVVLVGFVVGTGKNPWWHDVLIYDVRTPSGKESSYAIMDPGPQSAVVGLSGSGNAQYVEVSRKYFFPQGEKQEWLIGWSKTAKKR